MDQPGTRYGLEIPTNKSVEELISLTQNKPPACWSAYTALGHNTSDQAIPALDGLLASSDWTHVRSAIEAIGNNVNGFQLEDRLIAFLDDNIKFVVIATIRPLSKLKSTKSHDKMIDLANRDNI